VQSTSELDRATSLAFERTRLAYERTMMAWVRTATSLITFGFTVYKFFQLEKPGSEHPDSLIGPREFALVLVSIGLGALLIATFEHRAGMQAMRAECPQMRRSLAAVVAVLISMLGLLALIAMLLRR